MTPSDVADEARIQVPPLSFGTWQLDDDAAARCVAGALRDGYRMVDTGMRYHNEYGVGRGVRESGVPREEITVVTKLRAGDQGARQTTRAFRASLRNLGLDRVDLYLIHWPVPRLDKYIESYREMIGLRRDGLIGELGVSNFPLAHLDRLADAVGEYPAINQFEMHPGWPQAELVAGCRERGVIPQGWGPLGRGQLKEGRGLLDDPVLARVAEAHRTTPATVCLAWMAGHDVSCVAKSSHPDRWRANLAAVRMSLSDEEIARIDAMPQFRCGKDPLVDEEY
ncbi:MAG: aldo/keto reductase [Acidipropionibacterium acidipropionici]|jgi:2,5-diketo-D-gluconate reductase A|uniref:Oxidoreductase n=1 Tax=Acidipropionibacterium acidipropionici (strain ATCC 4875 / DSM 20272 / JCM 6432 / NBRC 12425 / NCIMB 8070 / 4) TaxID=1171373 RepID=K7S8P6_ACIA4|nr:aldo/keto reductase [Acidipropionibacterium acidipropionici]AFV90922.1 Oxidoreductase [Acidipropionibacterium acidipropionici ATCC 4875]ALN14966.1 oxidoreductase [Acidipropionibacterium acidipropionici]APZ09283.1 oxidoreductase [Acidipropionibacterium acidipropionici]